MRILYFTSIPIKFVDNKNGYHSGGWMRGVIEGMSNYGYSVGVVYYNGNIDESLVENGIKIYSIGKRISLIKKLMNKTTHEINDEELHRKISIIIEDFEPDIIQIFGSENQFGESVINFNIPYIIHIQGILNVIVKKYFPDNISPFDLIKNNFSSFLKFNGFYHDYIKLKKRALREKNIIQNCNYFIGRTEWDRRILQSINPSAKYFHCDEILRDIFYNSLNRPINSFDGKLSIFSISDNYLYKGFLTIIKAAEILEQIGVEFEWKIAGISESDEIISFFKRKTKKNISRNITVLGRISEKLVYEEILKTNIFIHTSHIENNCNAIQEAMILRTPIIATYVGGVPSIIENGKEGILLQDGDAYSLVGTILEFSKNNNLRLTMSFNSLNKAKQRHDRTRILNKLSQIYIEVIEHKIINKK